MTARHDATLRWVCLQTMWRSCGTFVWLKFRHDARYCAFYEPCHERLIDCGVDTVEHDHNRVTSMLRHPSVDVHYRAEFPRMAGSVPLFEKRFWYENLCMSEDRVDDAFRDYLSSLVEHARRQQRYPVFKCCRWSLRTKWLRRQFDPTVLYVIREPDAMFRSYWSFGGPGSYFVVGSVLTVSKNRDAAVFAQLAEELRIPFIDGSSVLDEFQHAAAIAATLEPQALRDLILVLWTVSLAHNAASADAIIDMDLLADDKGYRKRIEQEINSMLPTFVSLEGAITSSSTMAAPGDPVSERGANMARRAAALLSDAVEWPRFQLSPETTRVLSRIL